MERQDLVKVLLMAVMAILFLTEIFAFKGTIPSLDLGGPSVYNVTGTATFNGTIRTYDPVLLVPVNTSAVIVEQLRNQSGVKSVNIESDGYLVDTETRDDVFPLATYLMSMNVSSVSVANIVIPQPLAVSTPNGTMNVSASGVVRVMTPPLLDVGNTVTVSMTAIVDNNGNLVDYTDASIMTQNIVQQFNASIISLQSTSYSYSIPWVNRSLGNLSRFGTVQYSEMDSIIFTTPLTVTQTIQKKQLPYIAYIGPDSAIVEPSFSNASLVADDFNDTNYTLPDSPLVITTNSSSVPDVPFNATVGYTYSIMLQNSTYDFGSAPLTIVTDKQYADNESVGVDISAVALGDQVIQIKSVSIPS